jgi:hypothetical protein
MVIAGLDPAFRPVDDNLRHDGSTEIQASGGVTGTLVLQLSAGNS